MSDAAKPNVLLFCPDQHTPHVLGCYGDPVARTPRLDRLAEEGVVFRSAYCNQPICVPSRMSFLTGRYPHRIDVWGNGYCLPSTVPTVAHALGRAGYRTALCGRMHFIGPDQRHGFQERPVGDPGPYAHWSSCCGYDPLDRHLGNMSTPAPLTQVGSGSTWTPEFDRQVTDAACAWLGGCARQDDGRPFLLTVGLFNPHCPYIAPRERYQRYVDAVALPDIPAGHLDGLHPFHKTYRDRIRAADITDETARKARAAYYALVEMVDECFGRVLDAVDRHGLADNTIVVYFSDHGDLLGEHGRWHKGCFYEGSVGVPLMVRWPGQLPAGRRVRETVSLVDLMPTLCQWTGAPVPKGIDGRSFAPLAMGDDPAWPDRALAEYYTGNDAVRMVREGPWKLVYYNRYQPELYNLDEDPAELHDRAADPACAGVRESLLQRVFADGWHPDLWRDADARHKANDYWYGHLWAREMRRHDPAFDRDTPDFWQPPPGLNWLD